MTPNMVSYGSSYGRAFRVVDRQDGDKLVLLDTNHHIYGHDPEVYAPLSTVLEAAEGPVRIHSK